MDGISPFYTKEVDVYQLAITIFEIFKGKRPNPKLELKNNQNITNLEENYPFLIRKLYEFMIVENPQDRPTINQVIQKIFEIQSNYD